MPRTGYYNPQNDEPGSVGAVSLYKATQNSINTAFVQLEQQVGVCKVAQMAASLGVHRASPGIYGPTKLEEVPSLTLGTNLIAPMTMAAAFATFAANGKFCQPIAITSITSVSGKKYVAPSANCSQVLDKGIAQGVTSALQKVLTSGTAAGKGLSGRESAGKTGTTNANHQAWFVGYTRTRDRGLRGSSALAEQLDQRGERRKRPSTAQPGVRWWHGRTDLAGDDEPDRQRPPSVRAELRPAAVLGHRRLPEAHADQHADRWPHQPDGETHEGPQLPAVQAGLLGGPAGRAP